MGLAYFALWTLLLRTAMARLYTMQDFNASYYHDRATPCQNNTVINANGSCVCVLGFEPSTDTCTACALGTFKHGSGNYRCSVCPMYTTTLSCASDSQSDCVCNPGYTTYGFLGAGYDCEPCALNMYKNDIGNHSCSACPDGSTSPIATVQLIGCLDSLHPTLGRI